jgi:hypothetical protein
MGYRGRKRRLKHFRQTAQEFLNAIGKFENPDANPLVKTELIGIRTLTRAKEKRRVGTRQRIVLKGADTIPTLTHQRNIADAIAQRRFKPRHFTFYPFRAEVFEGNITGVQEYFHKPNAEQLLHFLEAAQEKRRATRFGTDLTKKEYALCKKFLKNPVNRGVTIEKIKQAASELIEFMSKEIYPDISQEGLLESRDAHLHNVLIQGINKDGTLRITLIDV